MYMNPKNPKLSRHKNNYKNYTSIRKLMHCASIRLGNLVRQYLIFCNLGSYISVIPRPYV